jgi:hypothetical protein
VVTVDEAPLTHQCGRSLCGYVSSLDSLGDKQLHAPVRICWKADSTFDASSAEVSMKLSWFSAAKALASSVGTARRCLKSDLLPTSMMLCATISTKQTPRPHANAHNVGVGVITQLLEPPGHVDVGTVLRNIVDEQRADRPSVVAGLHSVRCVSGCRVYARRGDGAIPLLTGCGLSAREHTAVNVLMAHPCPRSAT